MGPGASARNMVESDPKFILKQICSEPSQYLSECMTTGRGGWPAEACRGLERSDWTWSVNSVSINSFNIRNYLQL